MKKLLMGIFGLTLLLPLGVFAETLDSVEEGSNSTSQSVTVGTVETPVYEASIIWENPSFDWVYNQETGVYNWEPTRLCVGDAQGEGEYLDDQCTTKVTQEEYDSSEFYYSLMKRSGVNITIVDTSTNGRIVPSVKWTSEEKYSYIHANFSYNSHQPICSVLNETYFDEALEYEMAKIYNNNSCSNVVEKTNLEYEENKYYSYIDGYMLDILTQLNGEELPDSARLKNQGSGLYIEGYYPLSKRTRYNIYLNLENKEQPTTTPTAGDTLGTITISIRAAE